MIQIFAFINKCHGWWGQDPAFFANLKQHVSLCQHVEENARKTPVLVALNETMSVSSMCGTVNCWDLVNYVEHGGVSLVTLMSVSAIAMLAVVIPAVNTVTRWVAEASAGNEYGLTERGWEVAWDDPHQKRSIALFPRPKQA